MILELSVSALEYVPRPNTEVDDRREKGECKYYCLDRQETQLADLGWQVGPINTFYVRLCDPETTIINK